MTVSTLLWGGIRKASLHFQWNGYVHITDMLSGYVQNTGNLLTSIVSSAGEPMNVCWVLIIILQWGGSERLVQTGRSQSWWRELETDPPPPAGEGGVVCGEEGRVTVNHSG